MMLVKLGISDMPPAQEDIVDIGEEGEEEIETDEDVLSLPSIADLAASLDLWTPGPLSKSAELNLKRAVISCLDKIGEGADRLQVEDIVAQAADNAPVDEIAVKLLRKGLSKVTSELENMIKTERERVNTSLGIISLRSS